MKEQISFDLEVVNDVIENADEIWKDLLKLHTELTDMTPGEHCVEIRAIKRKANLYGMHDKAAKGFHLWKDTKESKSRFLKWFSECVENQGVCLYASVHCFDSAIDAYNEQGKKLKKYSINSQNQLFTRVLVADFDYISEDENIKFDNIMDSLGIPFESIQTNELGYQKRIYLEEQVDDEYIVSKFTKLLISRGFKADPRLINRGQVVRLVGSINNKYLSPNFNRVEAFKVKYVRECNKKISINSLFKKIKTLEIVDLKYNNDDLDINLIKKISKTEYKNTSFFEEEKFKENYKKIIPSGYYSNLQKPIKHMLLTTEEGLTDSALMFLIPFFKNNLKLSFEQTEKILLKWAEINNYTEIDKFERLYYTKNDAKFGVYEDKLKSVYGSINWQKNYDTVIKINDNTVNLKPEIFDVKIYKDLDNTALKVFLTIAFEFKASGKITWETHEIAEQNAISKNTITKCLKELTEKGFVSRTSFFKGSKKENSYTISNKFLALKTERRVEFGLSEIRDMLRALKGNEIKMFIYMKYMVLKSKDCVYYGNQEDIAKIIGISQQNASLILNSLCKKRFLNIEKIKLKRKNYSNQYTLLI